ncbi:MAG: nucleotidyl transferase AbiEii/AbiGii toxin family protein, partial [Candidatus Omnitrophota bacterium]|nr:nucleotidyl transferase AbiEii/AbiGii toxin family protein [Candidatus Omnitrophota bacterium]
MRDYIKSVVDPNLTQNQNLNRIREYLQAYFLHIIYKNKFYQNLVFTGGTALRFIYKIRRFSEDLDFSLSTKAKNYNFTDMVKNILQEFKLAGYDLEIKYNDSRTVHNALLKFSGILFEAGLSPLKSQKIAIKMEVDSNPPKGGKEESSVYNGLFTFYTVNYDLASLFAGKVHAVLCREYTKGRDWFDLFWYLSKFKELEPNFIMLNNAMSQTEKDSIILDSGNWKTALKKTAQQVNFS